MLHLYLASKHRQMKALKICGLLLFRNLEMHSPRKVVKFTPEQYMLDGEEHAEPTLINEAAVSVQDRDDNLIVEMDNISQCDC